MRWDLERVIKFYACYGGSFMNIFRMAAIVTTVARLWHCALYAYHNAAAAAAGWKPNEIYTAISLAEKAAAAATASATESTQRCPNGAGES